MRALPSMTLMVALLLGGRAAADGERGRDEPDGAKPADLRPRFQLKAGAHEAPDLVQAWAKALKRGVTMDPQLRGVRLELLEAATVDAETLRHLLLARDVVVVEREGVLEAHHRRNAVVNLSHVGPVVSGSQSLPPEERLVTAVVRIKHASMQELFGALRGIAGRDGTRIGNILPVASTESIIISDLTSSVRYYLALVQELDQPAPMLRMRLAVLEVEQEAWLDLAAEHRGAALLRALERLPADKLQAIEDATLVLGPEGCRLSRALRRGADELTLEVAIVSAAAETTPRGEAPRPPRSCPAQRHRLDLSLALVQASGEEVRRRLQMPLPALPPSGEPVLASSALRAASRRTQLVVALRAAP